MDSVDASPHAIVVLGMHRSGTSALMGVLHRLGVEVGPRLLPAQEGVNERGFWEHTELVEVHDRLLRRLDSSWDDVCPLPEAWWASPTVAPFRQEIMQILQRDFADQPLWGLKDPRLCRLLPLWRDIFTAFRCQVSCVIITRHPHEVVCSLAQRDGFAPVKSSLLWLAHVLEAEQATQTLPRVFVTYDALLNDWRATVARIAAGLSLS